MYNANITAHNHTTHRWLPQPMETADQVQAWACRTFVPGTRVDITDAAGRTVRTIVAGRETL